MPSASRRPALEPAGAAPSPAVEVYATFEVEGFHRWPDAHAERDYLRARHRHLFGICVWVRVSHDERDVEFHDLRSMIEAWWTDSGGPERDTASCESMATALGEHLARDRGLAVTGVEVNEDGENGAQVTWTR